MREMKKILFAVFTLSITANAWSLAITCKDRADTQCIIDSNFKKTTKCEDITKQSQNNYLYLDMDDIHKCPKQLHDFFAKMPCSTNHIQPIGTTDGYLWYCDNNLDITLTYTNEQTDTWSYAQKRCVGSSGDWKNGQCTCDQDKIPGTTLQNGECICANNTNQKYFNKLYTGCEMLKNGAKLVWNQATISGVLNGDGADTWDIRSIDRANSCDITGGDRQGNKCNCETTLNLEPNASEYYCNCKAGTDYKNPLYKNEGCISTTDIPDYNTINFTHNIHTESNPVNTADEQTVDTTSTAVSTTSTDNPQTLTTTELDEKLKSAQNALKSAQDTEGSLANRLLGGASTAATGLGGMMIAQGLAEQKADKDAEADMRAYLATFKCEYGNGQYANAGNEEITLPGGNELLEYYNEYKTLADNLKTTKTALGLRTGIESEVLYDRAQTGLYQYANAGKTGGGETSLYRALTDSESADAAAWAEQKDASDKKLKTGAIVAGAGVVGGIAGNYLINGRNQKTEEIKQEFKKAEERIEKEYPQSIVSIPELKSKTVSELKTILPSNITQSSSTLESIQTLSIKNFQSDESIFDPGEFKINNTHTGALDKYLAETENILSNPDNATVKVCISVIGHTDRTIPKPRQEYKDNRGLSELRANSVKTYVESKLNNVKDHIISIISKGKGDEECFEGYYARNDRNCRRVEINIMDCSRISPELL